jgi:hypothetical protein
MSVGRSGSAKKPAYARDKCMFLAKSKTLNMPKRL